MKLLYLSLAIFFLCGGVQAYDYVYARGDPFQFYINDTPIKNGNLSVWGFSSTRMVLDKQILAQNYIGKVELPSNITNGWEPQDWKFYVQWYGNNSIQEVFYEPDKDTGYIQSPWKKVKEIEIGKNGAKYDPYTVESYLRAGITKDKYSDDNLTVYTVKVENPAVIVTDLTELEIGILALDGYTNVQEGSTLTFIWDEDKMVFGSDLAQHTYITKAEGEKGGYRKFHILIPVQYKYESIGQHYISAKSPLGDRTNVPVYVNEVWETAPHRNETIKYIGGDPFHKEINQTPQPQVTVTVTVTVPVPVKIMPEPSASPTPEPFEDRPAFDFFAWLNSFFWHEATP